MSDSGSLNPRSEVSYEAIVIRHFILMRNIGYKEGYRSGLTTGALMGIALALSILVVARLLA